MNALLKTLGVDPAQVVGQVQQLGEHLAATSQNTQAIAARLAAIEAAIVMLHQTTAAVQTQSLHLASMLADLAADVRDRNEGD